MEVIIPQLNNFIISNDNDDNKISSRYRDRLLLQKLIDNNLNLNNNGEALNFTENNDFLKVISEILKCFSIYDKYDATIAKGLLNKINNINSNIDIELFSLIRMLIDLQENNNDNDDIFSLLIKKLKQIDNNTIVLKNNLISLAKKFNKDDDFFLKNDYEHCYKAIKYFFHNKFKWNKKNFLIDKMKNMKSSKRLKHFPKNMDSHKKKKKILGGGSTVNKKPTTTQINYNPKINDEPKIKNIKYNEPVNYKTEMNDNNSKLVYTKKRKYYHDDDDDEEEYKQPPVKKLKDNNDDDNNKIEIGNDDKEIIIDDSDSDL